MRFFRHFNQWKNSISQGLSFELDAYFEGKVKNIPPPKFIHLRLHNNIASIRCLDEGQPAEAGQLIQFDPLQKMAPVVAPFAGIIGKVFEINNDRFVVFHLAEKQQLTQNVNTKLNINTIDKDTIKNRIYESGLVGMGGAGYPTHLKLSKKVDSVIMNAIECEPLVGCDDVLLRLYPYECLVGLNILALAVDANQLHIALEEDANEARKALQESIKMASTPLLKQTIFTFFSNIYPLGSEKSINKVIFNDEIPKGKHISDLNRVTFNVSTCFSVYNLFANSAPIQWRMLSFVDMTTQHVLNCRVPLGTPLKEFLASIDQSFNPNDILFGGLMMGRKITDALMPIEHTTHAIFKLNNDSEIDSRPCIRCGACDQVCPVGLLPQQLFYFREAEIEEKLVQHGLFDCIECGCCEYVCPSHISLVETYQIAKQRIHQNRLVKERVEHAKARFDTREDRLAKIETERLKKIEEKKKIARSLLQNKDITKPNQSAIERAKEAARKQKEKAQKNAK